MLLNALIIVKILAATYSTLVEIGIETPMPMAICADNNLKAVLKALTNFRHEVFSANSRKDEILSALTRRSADPLLFYYDGSYKADTRFKQIVSAVKAGEYEGRSIKRLPVIVLEGIVTDEVLENVICIEAGDVTKDDFSVWDYLPKSEELMLVFDKISQLDSDISEEEKIIRAGMCFMYPYFKFKEDMNMYESLHQEAKKLAELSYQAKDSYGISAQFIKALYEFKRTGEKVCLIELPNVNTVVFENAENAMFYDHQNLYMSNKTFSKITEGITRIIGLNRLKAILVDEGILQKGKGVTYMSKMNCNTQYGELKRLDYLRFTLSELAETGEMNLIEYYGG